MKIIREPRQHDEHVMFLRLAAELHSSALRVLAAVHGALDDPQRARVPNAVIEIRTGLPIEDVDFWMDFLAGQGLFDRTKFQMVASPGGLEYLLTGLGKQFENYRRG